MNQNCMVQFVQNKVKTHVIYAGVFWPVSLATIGFNCMSFGLNCHLGHFVLYMAFWAPVKYTAWSIHNTKLTQRERKFGAVLVLQTPII